MRPGVALLACACLLLLAPRSLRADEPPAPAEDSANAEARREFLAGAELVKSARWAEALTAFERAGKLKPHAITTFNVAQCERAMGQYAVARARLLQALQQDDDAGHAQLPASAREQALGLVAETDRILPRARVTLRPADAAVGVDGRPLARVDDEPATHTPVLVAGTLPPGPARPPPAESFVVVLDPGTHVFTVSRQGYQDVVVHRTLAPGSTTAIDLVLDRLPALIGVASNLPDAIVRVNGVDVGNPPAEVSRAAGRYAVTVSHAGYVTYEADVLARPGERVDLTANLHPLAVTQRWWFWAGTAALVIGAGVATYYVTRPEPQATRPSPDGGGLGWFLKVP